MTDETEGAREDSNEFEIDSDMEAGVVEEDTQVISRGRGLTF